MAVSQAEFEQREAELAAGLADALEGGAGSLEHVAAHDAYFEYVAEHAPGPEDPPHPAAEREAEAG